MSEKEPIIWPGGVAENLKKVSEENEKTIERMGDAIKRSQTIIDSNQAKK